MTDLRTRLFMFIVFFWFGILVISNVFHVSIITDDKEYKISGPSIVLKAMIFQHTEAIPYIFGLFLDFMGIITLFIAYTLISPLD